MTRRILGIGLLALVAAGCGGRSRSTAVTAQPFQGITLRVGIVGDPAITPAISAQRGEWEEKTGGKVEILSQPIVPSAEHPADVDVLVYSGDRAGDLIDVGALAVIPDSAVRPPVVRHEDDDEFSRPAIAAADPFDFPDVLPTFRDHACLYGGQRIAFPLGGSALVVVYRRDVFEKEKLAPPKTWDQLDALAKSLHGRDWNGDGIPDEGIALVTADDDERVGVNTFLARATALGQHPDQFSFLFDDDTMAPQVATPPFVETLTQMRALEAFGPKNLTAEEARKAFREGKVALLIDRAEKVGNWNDRKKPVPTGVAPLPGSGRVFDPDRKTFENASPLNRPSYLPHGGGWMVGIAAKSGAKTRDAAIDFLKHLTNIENSARLLGDRDFPMLPTRMSQLGSGVMDPRSAPGVNPIDWSKAVAESLAAPRVVAGLRIPEADGYLKDLAFDHDAFAGLPPESALEEVAKSWRERTARLDAARQLWHYRRTLNRPTPNETPPPRESK